MIKNYTSEELKIVSKRILEKLYNKKRLDGRTPESVRNPKIEWVNKNLLNLKWGNSNIYVRVFSELREPYEEEKKEGILSVFFNFSQLSDYSYEKWYPNIYSIEAGRVIDRGLRSGVIDLSKLYIGDYGDETNKCIAINIDIYAVDLGGNYIDAGFLGAMIALRKFKIPSDKYGLSKPYDDFLKSKAYCASISLFKDISYFDLTVLEKTCCTKLITFIFNEKNNIITIQKQGKDGLSITEIKSMVNKTISNLDVYKKIYEDCFKIDENKE